MKIIEIAPLKNGAHRNQSGGVYSVPDGWAVLADDMVCENFPFGEITVDNQTPPVVTSWTPLPMPEPKPITDPEPTTDEVLNTLLGVSE